MSSGHLLTSLLRYKAWANQETASMLKPAPAAASAKAA